MTLAELTDREIVAILIWKFCRGSRRVDLSSAELEQFAQDSAINLIVTETSDAMALRLVDDVEAQRIAEGRSGG